MGFLSKARSRFKEIMELSRYGGHLIYQIDIARNPNRRSSIYVLRGVNSIYYGTIRLHLNESSFLYTIALDELEMLAREIPKALDAVRNDISSGSL